MKKVLFRSLFMLGFLIVLLILFLFNPTILYSNKTVYKNCTIYHNEALTPNLYKLIDESFKVSKVSEIYNDEIQIDLCLNDGTYPKIIAMVMGNDVIRAFGNKSVVHGKICSNNDCMNWSGKKVLFTQWFCHSIIHNLQYHKLGFWRSNPIGGHADWKWEGYAEYISLAKNEDLTYLIERTMNSKISEYDWVVTATGKGTTVQHIKFAAMTKYCFEIKKMNYDSFFEDPSSYENVCKEMMQWYTLVCSEN